MPRDFPLRWSATAASASCAFGLRRRGRGSGRARKAGWIAGVGQSIDKRAGRRLERPRYSSTTGPEVDGYCCNALDGLERTSDPGDARVARHSVDTEFYRVHEIIPLIQAFVPVVLDALDTYSTCSPGSRQRAHCCLWNLRWSCSGGLSGGAWSTPASACAQGVSHLGAAPRSTP